MSGRVAKEWSAFRASDVCAYTPSPDTGTDIGNALNFKLISVAK